MNFKIAKQVLKNGVAVVAPCLGAGKGNDPLSGHFLFRPSAAGLEVLTYNGRVFSAYMMPGIVFEDGLDDFTMSGSRLKKYLNVKIAKGVSDDIDEENKADAEDSTDAGQTAENENDSHANDELTITVSLNSTGSKKIVRVVDSRGKSSFDTMDASKFPHWNVLLDAATKTADVGADYLLAALAHARAFICEDETRTPELCVTEIVDGCLRATNRNSAGLVFLAGMDKSNLRIHVKDLGIINSFLTFLGTEMVEVLEGPTSLFIRRASGGAIIGESRFTAKFPTIKLDRTAKPQFTWTVSKAEMLHAIRRLVATSSSTETKVLVRWAGGASLTMLMASDAGTDEFDFVEVALASAITADDAPTYPPDGPPIIFKSMIRLLEAFSDDTVVLQVMQRPNGGYFQQVRNDGQGNDYLDIVSWMSR